MIAKNKYCSYSLDFRNAPCRGLWNLLKLKSSKGTSLWLIVSFTTLWNVAQPMIHDAIVHETWWLNNISARNVIWRMKYEDQESTGFCVVWSDFPLYWFNDSSFAFRILECWKIEAMLMLPNSPETLLQAIMSIICYLAYNSQFKICQLCSLWNSSHRPLSVNNLIL